MAEHQESQDLQYQLADWAQALGWPAERIHIIDEDLGKSAVSSSERSGFQRLFTDVGPGKVGILLVTDVSRSAVFVTTTSRFLYSKRLVIATRWDTSTFGEEDST